jgi:uncharacterized membrane protein YeaQ/YmgE (transglycosylase-associated protein family)
MDAEQIKELANAGLTWIGFGTIVGLSAKALMPGRDPGGALATLTIGGMGSLIGCALLGYFFPGVNVAPVSVGGFCVGTAGAFIVLTLYKLLGGYWFIEGETHSRRLFRRRRRSTAYLEE